VHILDETENLLPMYNAGVFQKMILLQRPDYGSRLLLWKHLLVKGGATLSGELDVSALAKISGMHVPISLDFATLFS
jgi:hypothetical protein